jgi:hypothetical protein
MRSPFTSVGADKDLIQILINASPRRKPCRFELPLFGGPYFAAGLRILLCACDPA